MSWSKKMFNEREDEQLSVWSYYINIIFVCLLYITLLQLLNSWNVSFIILFDFQRIDWYIWDLILSLKILSGREYGNMMRQLVLLLTWQMNLNVALDLLSPHIPLVRKFFVYFLYSAIWGYLFPACLLLDTIVDEESIYLTGEAGERDLSTCSSPHPKSLVIETSQVFLVVASESFCKVFVSRIAFCLIQSCSVDANTTWISCVFLQKHDVHELSSMFSDWIYIVYYS